MLKKIDNSIFPDNDKDHIDIKSDVNLFFSGCIRLNTVHLNSISVNDDNFLKFLIRFRL